MELKGIENINEVLNDFLAEFDATAEMGEEFYYDYIENKIVYSVGITEPYEYFMKFFNNLAPDINCDPFLASFLHELGHHETMPGMDDAEEEECRKLKNELEEELCYAKTQQQVGLLHLRYFNLPIERYATNWAIEYMRNNTNKVKLFWQKLQEAIMNFYLINEVEGVQNV